MSAWKPEILESLARMALPIRADLWAVLRRERRLGGRPAPRTAEPAPA
jgi:hypothetical protein